MTMFTAKPVEIFPWVRFEKSLWVQLWVRQGIRKAETLDLQGFRQVWVERFELSAS